ncbi:MAG: hypothetical protein ACUVWN_09175 [bacterium]
MSIDFDMNRWNTVKENYRKWWAGELKRPLIQASIGGRDPGRKRPDIPNYGFTAFYDFSISAEQIVDLWDYNLSCVYYMGDAFPHVWPNFGPGVIAAFMGAKLEKGNGTCWFIPERDYKASEITFEYDQNNKWLKRIRDIYKACMERWEGLVQVGMTDLGGNLDIVSTFLPGKKILLDLYDNPDEIKRITWDAHKMWWKYFDEFNSILQPKNPGYTAWTPIFSEVPYYMLQCDFSFMISPEMFDEFVKPELVASCKKLSNPFYHLDGPGQLPHLDSLLEIPELKGIQWVPGAGAPDCKHWPEVYRKIKKAGKLIQLFGGIDVLDTVAEQIGSAEGIILIGWGNNEKEINDALKRYGVI